MREELKLPRKLRQVRIEMEEATFQKWLSFKGRMINKNWSDEKLLDYLLEQEKSLRDEKPASRPKAVALRRPSRQQRYVPAAIKRELWESQKHCQWPGCRSTYGLEIDHLRPIRENGQSGTENLRVLCKNHNQRRSFSS